MDALREHDQKTAHATPPEVKLAQAIALADEGLALQRAKLARANPDADADELARLFLRWLCAND